MDKSSLFITITLLTASLAWIWYLISLKRFLTGLAAALWVIGVVIVSLSIMSIINPWLLLVGTLLLVASLLAFLTGRLG